jgi:hypothetical protein
MHDSPCGFLGKIAESEFLRRLGEGKQLQLAPKRLLVEFHGFTAVSIKGQIDIDIFHDLVP